SLNHIRGLHVTLSTAGMMTGNFAKAFETPPVFDICVCDLHLGELMEFPQLVAVVQPFMAEKGVIAGFHLNQSFLALPSDHVLSADFFTQDVVRTHQVGSWTSAVMLRVMRYVKYPYARLRFSYATRTSLVMFVFRSVAQIGVLMLVGPIVLFVRTLKFI